MTFHEVLIEYESKLLGIQAGIAKARTNSMGAVLLLVIAVASFLLLGIRSVRQQISYVWPSISVPIAAVSARRFRRHRQSASKLWRLKRFYERAVDRIQGRWIGLGPTGHEFNEPDHVYATDLQVLGEGSLFELLCIARTSVGQRGLADYLLQPTTTEETRLRQDAVRELKERTDLRERIASLGEFDSLESKWQTFEVWLNSPKFSYPAGLRITAAITSGLLSGVALMGLIGLMSWTTAAICISPFLVFHAVIGMIFRSRVNEMANWVRPVSVETQLFREGLQVLGKEHFRSPKLRALTDQVEGASDTIRTLERLLDALHERQKDWFYVPSLLLLLGTQLCMSIEQWRAQHGEFLMRWLKAWAEFEALSSLAAYAFENPDHSFPELEEDVCFQALEMGHPLLPRDSCVTNNVDLKHTLQFYVISGSNMSGKSTLLRAIGLNAVLAAAGAPVRAASLRISGLRLFASLSVMDSLMNGKSRFMAEVDRLRLTIDSARTGPVLFLVDEILSGTNSRDRRIAAEAVVRTLIDLKAIGALSTHDLALCEIADSPGSRGINVHMGSPSGGGPLDFDYRLKPGATKESNALAIARMAGVPV